MPRFGAVSSATDTGEFNASAYGAAPLTIVTDAVTNASTTVTSATASFTSANSNGKTFFLFESGLAGVLGATITGAGSGYTPGSYSMGFSGGGGSGAAGTYTVGGGGTVTLTVMTNSGSGYTSSPTVSFPSGGGSGATATAELFRNVLTGTLTYVSSTTVTLSTTAYGSGSGRTLAWGSDATSAIQAAVDAADAAEGGMVLLNPGAYLVAGQLDVENNVNLQGVNPAPISLVGGANMSGAQGPSGTSGAQFPVQVGVESAYTGFWLTATGSTAAVTTKNNSRFANCYLYWPLQDPTDASPTAYPFGIRMYGANGAVENIGLVNAYDAIQIKQANRPYVRGVNGQVLNTVFDIDGVTDTGHISEVHIVPIWSGMGAGAYGYSVGDGVSPGMYGFKVKRCDGLHVHSVSIFRCYVGVELHTGSLGTIDGTNYSGNSYGWMTGCDFDACQFGVVVYDVQDLTGWTFQGCRFGCQHYGVIDASDDTHGPVVFTGCQWWGAIWGVGYNLGNLNCTGAYIFTGCHFLQYGTVFDISGSTRLQVVGCDLGTSVANDLVGSETSSAIFVGNFVKGGFGSSLSGSAAVSTNNNVSY